MFGLGLPELIIILVIILVLFGSSRLPKLSKSLGESARELRKGFDGVEDSPKRKSEASKSKKANSSDQNNRV